MIKCKVVYTYKYFIKVLGAIQQGRFRGLNWRMQFLANKEGIKAIFKRFVVYCCCCLLDMKNIKGKSQG